MQASQRTRRQVVLSHKAREALRDSEEAKRSPSGSAQPPAPAQADRTTSKTVDRENSPSGSDADREANGAPQGSHLHMHVSFLSAQAAYRAPRASCR